MLRTVAGVPPLADRLLRPQRLGIFGNRAVGKTTLLTMLYREASVGRLTGCRLAAADSATAAYLCDKVQQLEAGQILPGTLAETELHLNLYRGASRIELIVKDYQGEHVELSRDESIHAFLRDCDAVWLCFDAGNLADTSCLRRQQEFEQLVESYLAREPRTTLCRPFALILTKADQLAEADPSTWSQRLEMTRHTLDTHCPGAGLFAVSSLTTAPFALTPHNLEEPLLWLTAALQTQDESRLARLFVKQAGDLRLLGRGVECLARRYPTSPTMDENRQKLRQLSRRRFRRRGLVAGAAVACLAMGAWTYDVFGYRQTAQFETENAQDAAAVLDRWENYQQWHPTRHLLSPVDDRTEKEHVKLLAKEARQQTCQRRLEELRRQAADADADVEKVWDQFAAFRKEYPEVEAGAWQPVQTALQQRRAAVRARQAHAAYDELIRAEQRGTDLVALVARADQFLKDHAGSSETSDVEQHRASYLRRLDERDIELARSYSRRQPLHFQTRQEHYQRYLDRHPAGGAFSKEARAALLGIDAAWDRHDFRAVRDLYEQTPSDTVNLVARARSYLAAHPAGRFTASARELLRWSERVTTTQEYRVTLRGGHVEKSIARFFSLGPDLSVEIEVAGIRYGPTTITKNMYDPVWDFEFPRPIHWKLGDAVRIWVSDHDWKDRVVITIDSEENDPLAMKLLSGEVSSGTNTLTFESDFTMPVLPKIE